MVEAALEKFVIMVDDSKLVSGLGRSGLTMQVEVVQVVGSIIFLGYRSCLMKRRLMESLDWMVMEIVAFEGVAEHGLFLDMTIVVIIVVIIVGKEGVNVKSK
ncbi:hypothetical protein BC332_24056 [Capsicum chinense]|nr:hypothetical protein BC332_24056 [Capsicum chinense]